MEAATYNGWGMILVITTIICTANSIPFDQFVSLNSSVGNSTLARGTSGTSQMIVIPPKFPFFNRTYENIYVSSMVIMVSYIAICSAWFMSYFFLQVRLQGCFSFKDQGTLRKPFRFPLYKRRSNPALICPFWDDVDTTSSGKVYYNYTNGSAAIDNEIRKYFNNSADSFTATWVLIANWHNVGYFNNHSDKVNGYNNNDCIYCLYVCMLWKVLFIPLYYCEFYLLSLLKCIISYQKDIYEILTSL